MADDYLLAAVSEALEGVKEGFLPFLKNKFERDLLRQQQQQKQQDELSLYQSKLPLEEASKIREEQAKQAGDYKYKTMLESQKPDTNTISGSNLLAINPDLNVEPGKKYEKALVPLLKPKSNAKRPIAELYPEGVPRPSEYASGEFDNLTPEQANAVIAQRTKGNIATQRTSTQENMKKEGLGLMPRVLNSFGFGSNSPSASVPVVQPSDSAFKASQFLKANGQLDTPANRDHAIKMGWVR